MTTTGRVEHSEAGDSGMHGRPEASVSCAAEGVGKRAAIVTLKSKAANRDKSAEPCPTEVSCKMGHSVRNPPRLETTHMESLPFCNGVINVTQGERIDYTLPKVRRMVDKPELPQFGHKPKRPKVQSADSGARVTICIAAKSRDGCIVAASDCLISFPEVPEIPGLEDQLTKASMVSPRWYALLAGTPGPALSIMRRAQAIAHNIGTDRYRFLSLREIQQTVTLAYRDEFREEITDEILSRFGLDWEAFKQSFGRGYYADIRAEIRTYDLGVFFLVLA
jgi:hypothetical protein